MNQIYAILTTIFLGSFAILPVGASTTDYDRLKTEIQLRAPEIRTLKDRGMATEGTDGLLIPSQGATGEAKKLIDNENTARAAMFTEIANQTGAAPKDVARAFASRIPDPSVAAPDGKGPPSSANSGNSPTPADSLGFVPVSPGSSLPLKILTRPNSAMFASSSKDSRVIDGNVPGFTAYVVRSRTNGWYQLCNAVGKPAVGWMNADDVMEWKHHMVVSFTPPDRRNRCVIFKEKGTLLDIFKQPAQQRKALCDRYVREATENIAGPTAGVEPAGWARQKNQFYLFPILEQQEISEGGQDIMILKVAAATEKRGRVPSAVQEPAKRRVPMLDIVFVMDLTKSMGPFVDCTLRMLREMAGAFSSERIGGGSVRFGIWGYRDDPDLCEGIEFLTHNYTPDLQAQEEFVRTLATVRETKVDSVDYAEDVYCGVHDGIKETNWRQGAARMLVVVGDAPGRGPGEVEGTCSKSPKPEGTACGMNPATLRQLAIERSVYLSGIYLNCTKWRDFGQTGYDQFASFTKPPNGGDPSVVMINGDNPTEYSQAAREFTQQMIPNLRDLAEKNILPGADTPLDPSAAPGEKGRHLADSIFRNAFFEWNSANQELLIPRDIEGWVSDKDPADPARMGLSPEILITKGQLDDLARQTRNVLDAMISLDRDSGSGEDFFKELHAIVTISGRDPGRLREAKSLRESNHFSDFIRDLPYKSKIMGMSAEDWREMSADQSDRFQREIFSKTKFYSAVFNDSSKWRTLHANGEDVTPIPLDMLP